MGGTDHPTAHSTPHWRANAPLAGLWTRHAGASRRAGAFHLLGGLARSASFWHTASMRKLRKREFSVIVERDEEGYYVASAPELRGCHTQARSLDKLMERIREAIELCLEVERDVPTPSVFHPCVSVAQEHPRLIHRSSGLATAAPRPRPQRARLRMGPEGPTPAGLRRQLLPNPRSSAPAVP